MQSLQRPSLLIGLLCLITVYRMQVQGATDKLYKTKVTTADKGYAGTDSSVYIKFERETGTTTEVWLHIHGKNGFQRGERKENEATRPTEVAAAFPVWAIGLAVGLAVLLLVIVAVVLVRKRRSRDVARHTTVKGYTLIAETTSFRQRFVNEIPSIDGELKVIEKLSWAPSADHSAKYNEASRTAFDESLVHIHELIKEKIPMNRDEYFAAIFHRRFPEDGTLEAIFNLKLVPHEEV